MKEVTSRGCNGRFARVALVVGALACGCGDSAVEPMTDGSTTVLPDGGLTVTEPDIPWAATGIPPIAFTPCPPGWHERDIEGLTTCAPYPASGPEECEAHEAHFPGEAGCRTIGAECPAGAFAETLPTDGSVVYVLATAAGPGDGSLASPYPTLDDVPWDSLPAGTTVAIGKGTYRQVVRLPPALRLVGACVAETVISGDGRFGVPAVLNADVAGEPTVVMNLSVKDALGIGISASSGAQLSIDGVLIESAQLMGIYAIDSGTRVTARSLVVRGTRPDASGMWGRGLEFDRGASLEATMLLVEQTHEYGIFSERGSVVLADAVVRETTSSMADGRFGSGVWLQGGSTLEARRLFSYRNRDAGVAVSGGGAVLEDVVVESTMTQMADNENGRGFIAESATVEARRILSYRNRDTGIFLMNANTVLEDAAVLETGDAALDLTGGRGMYAEGGSLVARRVSVDRHQELGFYAVSCDVTLEDVAVRSTSGDPAVDWWGRGFFALGSTVSARRLLVDDNQQVGILLDRSDAVFEDTIVRATHPQPSGGSGDAIHHQLGGRLEARRLEISEANRMGVSILGMVEAVFEDVVVRDTVGAMQGGNEPSRAINVQEGTLTGTRILLERNPGLALSVDGGDVTLVSAAFRDTRMNDDGVNGWGLVASNASRVSARDIDIEGAHEFGVLAIGSTIELDHARIVDIRASTRESTPGHGVMSAEGSVRLTDFEVGRAATCGVLVTGPMAGLDLSRGVVESSAIGACVQVDGYDFSRLQEDVAYRDNGANLNATSLPVPAPPSQIPMF